VALLKVTEPVGVALLPLTVTVTCSGCTVVTLGEAGATVTVGVAFCVWL
jgi:multidrug transporter EmrE-like cation transporter